MVELFESFCVFLERKKKTSANTLASYQRDVKAFIVYLQTVGIYSADKIDHEVITKYVTYLKKHKKSAATVSRTLSSLRCFCKYLVSKKVITFNPMTGIKNEKVVAALPETMSSSDVDVLLAAPDVSTVLGIRDKAMLEVMYATGIRVSELISLTLADVSLAMGSISISANSSKERLVPLYPIAIEALGNYINNARDKLLAGKPDGGVLFLNASGEQMTRQGFWKIIKQYADHTEINADITPKILRHSFATHLLENGADINMVKEMMGHTALSSTKVYSKIVKNKYVSVYTNCHPRAKQI